MADHNTFNSSVQQTSMITPEMMASCVEDVEQFARAEMNKVMKEVELRLFVNMYAICVPEEKRKKTARAVRELRNREWRKALREAKGDKLEALKKLAKLS